MPHRLSWQIGTVLGVSFSGKHALVNILSMISGHLLLLIMSVSLIRSLNAGLVFRRGMLAFAIVVIFGFPGWCVVTNSNKLVLDDSGLTVLSCCKKVVLFIDHILNLNQNSILTLVICVVNS